MHYTSIFSTPLHSIPAHIALRSPPLRPTVHPATVYILFHLIRSVLIQIHATQRFCIPLGPDFTPLHSTQPQTITLHSTTRNDYICEEKTTTETAADPGKKPNAMYIAAETGEGEEKKRSEEEHWWVGWWWRRLEGDGGVVRTGEVRLVGRYREEVWR
jgi:hypothetical protein